MPIPSERTIVYLVFIAFFLVIAFTPVKVPGQDCTDPIPEDCDTVMYLGEAKGCACFVCNPGTNKKKVICTNDEEDKEKLFMKPKLETPP